MLALHSPLARSIVLQWALFFTAQGLVLFGVFATYGMGWGLFAAFLAITFAFHALLLVFLLSRRADFRVEGTDAPLSRVNLANTITFGRISSIPTVLFFVIQASRFPLLPVILPFLCLVFATDFIDGMVARRNRQVTFVGRYLDSASDYLMIIAVSIIFYVFRLVPLWFFILVLARLVLFAAGMAVLALVEGKADPRATFLGKVSIFATMVLYVLEVAKLFGVPGIGDPLTVRIIEYLVAGIIVASVADKAVFLTRMFSRAVSRTDRLR